MKNIICFAALLLLLVGCSPDEPPPVTYNGMPTPKTVLNVGAVNIVDHSAFQPSNSPYYRHQLTPTIAEAAKQWLTDSVQAGGTQGQALIVIKDASLSGETLPTSQDLADKWFKRQQGGKYIGHIEVSIEIQGFSNYTIASAEASHSITLPETPTDAERRDLYTTMLNGLMKDFSGNFAESIHQHLQNFLVISPASAGTSTLGTAYP